VLQAETADLSFHCRETLLQIRSDIPVILCTGYSSRSEQKKAEKVGVRGCILMSFSKKERRGDPAALWACKLIGVAGTQRSV